MWINISGEISFKRKLTSDEFKEFIDKFQQLNASQNFAYFNDIPDISDDISEWLKSHNNEIEDGTVIEYYGDYDGCYRFENGDWRGYDKDSLCKMSDEDLFDELKYRGYDISHYSKEDKV